MRYVEIVNEAVSLSELMVKQITAALYRGRSSDHLEEVMAELVQYGLSPRAKIGGPAFKRAFAQWARARIEEAH